MKKLRLRFIVFLILIGFSFLPIGYAEECDYDYLKQLASVVDVHSEIDYEAVEVGLYSRNIVTLVGLNNDIYAITDDGSVGFFYEDMVDGSIVKVIDNTSIENLELYSTKCPDKRLRVIDLNLKKYNAYSDFEECDGLEDEVDACSKFYSEDISYEQLLKKIKDYENDQANNENNENSNNTILEFIKNNFVFFVVAIVVIVGIFAWYRAKKNRLD